VRSSEGIERRSRASESRARARERGEGRRRAGARRPSLFAAALSLALALSLCVSHLLVFDQQVTRGTVKNLFAVSVVLGLEL
jgi:hypothetical protein